MKPRRVMVSIETTTNVSFNDLRAAGGGKAILKDLNGYVICDLAIEQVQVNVIRTPKAPKKVVRR